MAVRQESFTIFLGMVVLPLLVYIGSFSGRITSTSPSSDGRCPYHTDVYTPGLGWRFSLAQLWHLQGEIACFHEHLSAYNATTDKTGHTIETPAHPYESRPWEWIYLGRPVAYYFHGPGTEILGIGNPAIFWFAILAVPWVGFMALRRRDWKAGLIFVAVAAQYLPWFIPPALDKVQFLFYATPISPFFVLADVYVLRDLSRFRLVGSRSRPFLPIAIGFIVTSVAVFAWFWPVLTGYHLSGHAWHQRMWFPRWI